MTDKRDKSKDNRPGGPDERFDRVERMIRYGRHDDADHAMDLLTRDLDTTDPVLKRNERMPALRKMNLLAKSGQAPLLREPVRDPLPGPAASKLSEDEWARVDAEAKRLVHLSLELGGDPDRVGNRAIDEIGEDYGIPPGTSKDRKRLVRKVRDHVDRWVERHAA